MEKRLLLAVLLSLGVAIIFQSMFSRHVQDTVSEGIQNHVSEAVIEKQTAASGRLLDYSTATIEDKAFLEEISTLNSDCLHIEFTNKGGGVYLVEAKDMGYIVPVKQYASLASFDAKQFKVIASSDNEIIYEYKNDKLEIKRKYKIESKRVFSSELTITNLDKNNISFNDNFLAFIIDLSRMDKFVKESEWTLFEYCINIYKNVIRKNNLKNFNNQWNTTQQDKIKWFGFRDRYFATILEPKFNLDTYNVTALSADALAIGAPISYINIAPNQKIQLKSNIYVGPQKLEELQAADTDFSKIMVFSNWGWLDAIAKAIYWLLGMTHKFIPNWGLCIIIVSIFVYSLMYPLTLKSLVSMKKMQVLQPKIKDLQEKYNKSPEKLNQEIMELYRKHGVNPLGGCLPMLLQMPIFVGLYQVLWRSIYFRGEKFLWIQDLSLPDRLFKLSIKLPFIGEYLNILPLLMIGIMTIQQHFSSKNIVATDPQQVTQQKMMTIFFPIFIGFIFYNFASGLNLYFVVFYLLSTLTQWKLSQDRIAV